MKRFFRAKEKVSEYFKKNGIKEIIKDILNRKSPHEVAAGASLGMFLSVLPTFGIGMILALIIAWKRKYNLISTYLGTLLVNPFTGPFVYFLDYMVGAMITGAKVTKPISSLMSLTVIKQIFLELFLGGLILGILLALITYIITMYSVIEYQRIKKKVKEKRKI